MKKILSVLLVGMFAMFLSACCCQKSCPNKAPSNCPASACSTCPMAK